MWVNVNEVDWPGARRCQNSEVVSFWKKRIEGAECVGVWVVTARDVGLHAEAGFQWRRRNPITGFRGEGPGANISRTEAAELPEAFVVEVPSWPFRRDGPRNSGAQRMAHFLRSATLESRPLAIEAQVIKLQGSIVRQRVGSVHTPETNGVIRCIVEEPGIVEVRANRESVELPGIDFAFDDESIEAQTDIRALPDVDQAAGPVFEFLSANSQLNGIFS